MIFLTSVLFILLVNESYMLPPGCIQTELGSIVCTPEEFDIEDNKQQSERFIRELIEIGIELCISDDICGTIIITYTKTINGRKTEVVRNLNYEEYYFCQKCRGKSDFIASMKTYKYKIKTKVSRFFY